jgi:acyl carrier protein
VVLVLRTAREVAAEALGTTLDQVRPETSIKGVTTEVLEKLYERVMGTLSQEQSLEHFEISTADPQRLGQMSRELGDLLLPTVAAATTLVTHAAVRLLLASRLDEAADKLEPDLHFAHDLGADSLTRVDLVLLLEEALEVSVPDDSMSLVQTVGDAELFSVLFDRTREEIIIALGEEADDLALDTPLADFGDLDGRVAIAAAARAVNTDLPFCHRQCHTLKDAVRLAYLTEKIRAVLARASGCSVAEIGIGAVPERDLGLSADRTRQLLAELARSLDIDPSAVDDSPGQPLTATVCALADASTEDNPGPLR